MKTLSRVFWAWLACFICLDSPNHAQDFGTRQSIDSTDFYIFTEAGGQYIPSIQFNNSSYSESGSFSESVSGIQISASGTFSAQISDFVVQPSIGYDFILGFGYQINKNLGLEVEVGYAQTTISSGTYNYNESVSGKLDVNGTTIANGTLAFNGTQTLNGNIKMTQIPVLINFVAQERSGKFQPLASVGIGVCPSMMSGNISSAAFNGNITATGPGGSVSVPYSGSTPLDETKLNFSTAYPFAFKFKVGFDYALSPYASLGLRAWVMGLANSDFGSNTQSDLYGALGLNASLKIRF